MPEGRILSECTTHSIPMPGNIGLLCSKNSEINSTYETYRFQRPSGPIIGPSLISGRYNQGLHVSENDRSLRLIT